MKSNIRFLAVGAALTLATFSSCKKETTTLTDTDTAPASNHALADNIFTEAQNIADDAAANGSVSFKTDGADDLLSGCAIVSRDTTSSPRVMTIDFGTGCTGNDGRTRAGKIIVSYTGKYKDAGTTITYHFQGYSVNGNLVSDNSTKTVINMGRNASNNLYWNISASGSIALANNGGTVIWSTSRSREMLAGESTAGIFDDKYSVTGSASGTSAAGLAFNAVIDAANPLIRDMSCGSGKRHFTQGKVTLSIQGKADRVIDFGSGACDNEATVTVNGHSRVIYL